MTGWTAWLAGWLLAVGPNGWWFDAQWAQTDELQRALVPIEWLGDTTGGLWLVSHRQDGWQMAFYLPPGAEEMAWARALPLQASERFERLLPRLDVPRLVLRSDVYRRGDGLVDPGGLAVDSAEALYNALLDAHFDLGGRDGFRRAAGERAALAMAGVPEAHRVEAFRNAAVDFGSHLLSVANEIGRLARRKPAHQMCALLDHPATLFGTWRRALGDGSFPGRWQRPADPESGRPAEWVTTRDVLRPEDKRWLVSSVLGARWTGEPRADFAPLCGS